MFARFALIRRWSANRCDNGERGAVIGAPFFDHVATAFCHSLDLVALLTPPHEHPMGPFGRSASRTRLRRLPTPADVIERRDCPLALGCDGAHAHECVPFA